MVKIIKEYPGDRQRLKIIDTGCALDIQFQVGIFRLESQRYKSLKTAGFILQITQHLHMCNPVGNCFNVAV